MTGNIYEAMKPGFFTVFPTTLLLLLCSVVQGVCEVTVSSELSRPQVNAGEMTELQVKVTGAQQADVPQQIAAEGLQIRLTGQSTQVQMVNFKVSSSAVYSYIVMPLRTGRFTIPSVAVSADGRQFRTAPLAFSVQDNGAAVSGAVQSAPLQAQPSMPGFSQRQSRPAPQRPETGPIAFGEISCPKHTLYAGEMTPVEIRYYFDARYAVQVRGRVDFGSEGILVERFPDPKEGREDRDGITYNVLTFHSLLSAVKPGSIDIAPAKLDSQIQMPGTLPPGFDDPVFRQMLGGQAGFGQTRDISVKTAPLHLEVLPLPKEGRPASFAGAVGQFDIDAIVTNRRPSPGDPANLVVKIGGRGNFKGMGPPVLTDTDGWRTYPPSDKFDSSDELSYTGVKSFDFTLIAKQPQHASPGAEFSYFDPLTSKYTTLSIKPLPLEASPGNESSALASLTPSAATPQSATPPPTASPSPIPKDGDPLPGITLHSWTTPVSRPEFLIASLAMFAATTLLAGFLYLRDLHARGGSPASRRKRRLAELWSRINSETENAATAYDSAVEYAGLTSAASQARDSLLTSLEERRDLLKYGSGGSVPLTTTERDKLLESLRSLS